MTKRLSIALVAVALFVLLAVMPAAAILDGTINQNKTIIGSGVVTGTNATVFIGETGLDISDVLTNAALAGAPYTQICWFPSTAQVTATTPEKIVTVTDNRNFAVTKEVFASRTGNWYGYPLNTGVLQGAEVLLYVEDPQIGLKIWDLDQNKDVSGKNVVQGTRLTFQIASNAQAVTDPAQRPNIKQPISEKDAADGSGLGDYSFAYGNATLYGLDPFRGTATAGLYGFAVANRTAEGFIDIKVKTTEGATLNRLLNASTTATSAGWGLAISQNIPLTGLFVTDPTWYWGNASAITYAAGGVSQFPVGNNTNWMWQTGALLDNLQNAYPAGTYTITAEWNLNAMKDNYKDGTADFAGKTISEAKTVTLVSDTVKIEANKDSVVRSNAFSVTITGKPNQIYYLWVKGTRSMNGNLVNDMPPYIVPDQTGVVRDTNAATAGAAGSINHEYMPQNLNRWLGEDVPFNNCWTYYCRILTNENGVRTVEWMTSNWTKAQTYNFRVENQTPGVRDYRTDEVSVKVEKGAVTITASGDGSYYLGEEVKFSGTNTESKKTYLFIMGPNLNANGSNIDTLDPRLTVYPCVATDNDPTTFKVVDVLGDNTWSWKWGTATVALDAGTYTVYAVSAPNNRGNLADVAYGTVSIIIKKPFVSATVSQSTLAKGDKLYVRGTAEGKPSQGVMMWVLGKNFVRKWTTSVESDASFEFDQLDVGITAPMAAGQYFVVVQHPMQNDQFDINLCGDAGVAGFTNNEVCNLQLTGAGTKIFTVLGAGSLQGSDAAEALVQGINDANVDDTYTKLQFLVEEPVINIDTIGDRHVGDKFTITAKTNLAVDDEVLFEVYSSSFKPTQKSQSGEFSGATGTVKVTKGDTGMNQLAFDVDASTFKPDEYIVTASAVIQSVTGTALFNVLEGAAPTAAVTTAAQPTTASTTAAPTEAPTTAAPTKTPTQPGFGALIALIGLGAVALLVVRRH